MHVAKCMSLLQDEDINNEVVRLGSLVKLQADQIILSQRQHTCPLNN